MELQTSTEEDVTDITNYLELYLQSDENVPLVESKGKMKILNDKIADTNKTIMQIEQDLLKIAADLFTQRETLRITQINISYLRDLSFEGRPDKDKLITDNLAIVTCRLHYLGKQEYNITTLTTRQRVNKLTLANLKTNLEELKKEKNSLKKRKNRE